MFLSIAHRGDRSAHRENTMASFDSAIGKGANALEFDLRLTRDGRIVVLHDSTLDRLWGVPAEVADLSFDEVVAAGRDGFAIPAFRGGAGHIPRRDVPGRPEDRRGDRTGAS
jgi:glycerophosphoryl diester phosphodiesterase